MSITDIWAKLDGIFELLDKIYHLIDKAMEEKHNGY